MELWKTLKLEKQDDNIVHILQHESLLNSVIHMESCSTPIKKCLTTLKRLKRRCSFIKKFKLKSRFYSYKTQINLWFFIIIIL